MKKLWNKYVKKALAMTLIAALLIQILPATAKGAEFDTTTFEEPEAEIQTGLSDIYEYETYEVGKAGTIHVNTYTGKTHIRRTDMTLGGERMPVVIEFYYDPVNTAKQNPYGLGWSCTYSQLLVYNSSEERYEYKNENGTWLYFVDSGELNEDGEEIWTEDTAYGIRETGSEMYLSVEAEEEDYTKAKLIYDGNTHVFDSLGRLVQISDEYNSITIAYVDETEKIDYIVDPVGRTFLFFYTAGYLNAIYATTADGTRIDYTEMVYRISRGVLNGVIYGYEVHNEYIYSSGGIQRIIDIDGCGYELAYSSGKISSIIQMAAMGTDTEEAGAVVTYEYPADNQTIITNEGSRNLYTFDDWGRTIGCELQSISADTSTEETEYTTVYGYNMTYDYVENEDGSITNALIDVEYYDENGVIEEDASGEESDAEETEASEESETEVETESEVEEEYETLYDEYGNVTAEIHRVGDLQQETRFV